MPSMPSPLSVIVPPQPLGAVPATTSGRFDAIPLSVPLPHTELPPEDKLARVIGTGLGVFLSVAGSALFFLTLAL